MMSNSKPRKVRRRGFTLTEMAIVIGVMGLITGVIWAAAGNVSSSRKASAAVDELQTVAQNILNVMQGQKFSGAFPVNETNNFITSGAIPSVYVDVATPTTADNPWSSSNFIVQATAAKTLHIIFNRVSQQGCMALLLQGTSCQFGSAYCPTEVYTNGGGSSCSATQSGCTGALGTSPGWTNMTVTQANTLCGLNSYTGGTNSVEFDYSL